MTLRIALIQTPVEDYYTTRERQYPLGLLSLAAAVQDLPAEVKVFDFLHNPHRHSIPLPENFHTLKPLLKPDSGPLSAFHQYYHFGSSWPDIEQILLQWPADIYGISSNFYTYTASVKRMAAMLKNLFPVAVVIVGGQNVNPHHDLFESDPNIDILIRGEGEGPFREFVSKRCFPQTAAQIPVSQCDAVDQAGICLPRADLLPPDAYRIGGRNAVMLMLTRGCPLDCSFCTVREMFGRKQKRVPVDRVLAFIDAQYQRGIRVFDIEDDNFTFNRSYALSFLNAVTERALPDIEFRAMNGVDARFLDEDILKKMREAGFRTLNLSLAAFDPEVLRRQKRPSDPGHFADVCRSAAALGYDTVAYFIAGLPGTHPDEVIETMAFLAGLPVILGISPFYHIPGMDATPDNIPGCPEDARLTRFFPADSSWSELSLITLFRLSRLLNAVKALRPPEDGPALPLLRIPEVFPNETVIAGSIIDRNLYGQNKDGTLFVHPSDPRVLDTFFRRFADLPIEPT